LDWIRAREDAGGHFPAPERGGKAGSIDTVRRERERQRVFTSEAWNEWKESGIVSIRSAQQLFRIDEYTTKKMAAIKVARLRSMFDAQDELSHFLGTASERVLEEGGNER